MQQSLALPISTTLPLPALALLSLGLILIYCVGFASPSVAHNATHDTRHANGFPCH